MTDKSISGLGLNSRGSGSGGGAPTDAAYLLATSVGAGALTQYRVASAGPGITITDGGALGNIVISAPAVGTVTSITGGINIVATPDPITSTGSVDTGKSLSLGSQTATLPLPDGVIDISSGVTPSVFTGIPATGATLINMTSNNNYGGDVNGVIVAGGNNTISDGSGTVYCSVISGNGHSVIGASNQNMVTGSTNTLTGNSYYNVVGGAFTNLTNVKSCVVTSATTAPDGNSLNNVVASIVCGIAHNLSGATSDLLVCGYNNTVTGGGNNIVGGQQNTVTNSGNCAVLGIQASISNTERGLVGGQGNLISGGVNNSIVNGQSNGITTGTRCSAAGYGNAITTAEDTHVVGYSNTFTGSGAAAVNLLYGYNNTLGNSLAHRFNQVFGENFGNRAATVCNNIKALCVGVPSTSFDNGAGKICAPAGKESSGTVVIFGNEVAIGCGGGEVRVYDKNMKSSVVPTTGDEYCNKTYVDAAPPSSRFISIGFQYKGNWNYTYTASGGNADVAFSSMNGGLAPDTYGSFDPLSSFVVSAAAMASILLTTTSTQVVKFCVSGSLSYGFGTSTDDNATYLFQLKQAGSSLKNLSRTNAVSMYNNQLAPAVSAMYPNMSGSNTANITAGTSLFELYLVVSGSDNAAHNLVFDNIEFRIEMWN